MTVPGQARKNHARPASGYVYGYVYSVNPFSDLVALGNYEAGFLYHTLFILKGSRKVSEIIHLETARKLSPIQLDLAILSVPIVATNEPDHDSEFRDGRGGL